MDTIFNNEFVLCLSLILMWMIDRMIFVHNKIVPMDLDGSRWLAYYVGKFIKLEILYGVCLCLNGRFYK